MSNSIEKLRAKKITRKKEADIGIYDAHLDRPTLSSIQIDEELRSYIPPLKPEELIGLEESIRKEHVRDKLIIWQSEKGEFILVDGHNRFNILQKLYQEGLKINYQTEIISFSTREAVKDWMIANQLSRRNLTLEQASYLRGLRYNREKSKHGGSRKETSPQNEDLKTSHRLAVEFKVGKATIERDGQYAMGLEKIGEANPDLKRSILAGEVKLSKTIIQNLSQFKGNKKKLQNLENIKALMAKPKNKVAHKSDFLKKKEVLLKKIKDFTEDCRESDIQEAIDFLNEMRNLLK